MDELTKALVFGGGWIGTGFVILFLFECRRSGVVEALKILSITWGILIGLIGLGIFWLWIAFLLLPGI